MKYRWTLAPPQPLLAAQLAARLGISPLLAQCLLNRGLDEPAAIEPFLQPRLRNLSDPFLLPDMAAAVERLLQARRRAEPVVVFGDYDVDGVTATALLLEVLGQLGWSVDFYLPHRMDEGYGLSRDAVENCLRNRPAGLLLAVDCGSTAVETIAWLRQRGVEVIVLDHHQVSQPPPDAIALVNPQRLAGTQTDGQLAGGPDAPANPRQPMRELCSVGLAFKLAHALVKRGRQIALPGAAEFDLKPLLDLVALGTIADVVPLTGENRIFAATGLARLDNTARPGLIALKRVAQCSSPIGPYEVGFQLAPRLNAAGRLETAQTALALLRAPDEASALPLAEALEAHNRERQRIERAILEEVLGAVHAKFNPQTDYVIVEGRSPWHIGVVGIVAARVVQEFWRPALIVGGEGAVWRGSGRSIPGFDLAGALRACGDLLERHGGHAMAAGVSVRPERLDALRARLNELASRTLRPEDLQPPLRLDAEVGLEEITPERVAELERIRPTGAGNPGVQLCARGLRHQRPLQRIGRERQHVKLWVTDGAAVQEAVWWGAGEEALPVGTFDLAFAPELNNFNGRSAVQLRVLDWRPAA